jgi:hypothetical protein
MNRTDQNSPDARRGGGHVLHNLAGAVRRAARAAVRAARAVAAVLAECNRAQRRMAELRLNPDRFLLSGGTQPPDTYAEFLFRTSGLLAHEPPADKRSRGRQVRR